MNGTGIEQHDVSLPDVDTGTDWATSGVGDDGSITLDLGSAQQIAGVEFLTRSMADGTSIIDTYRHHRRQRYPRPVPRRH